MEALLAEMRSFARANHVPVMLDGSVEVLKETIEKHNPKRILEIGTAIGYSGIIMLSAAPDAKLYTIEIDEATLAVAKENFRRAGLLDRVVFWSGDACEIIRYLTGEFDFILLDGPKGHYNEFLPYIKDVMGAGSVLFADNVLFKGYTSAEVVKHKHRTIVGSMRGFLENVYADKGFESEMLDVGDGISITVKK